MKAKKEKRGVEELLQDLMIVQLGLAGINQHQIREIVGVDMHRVTRIVRHFKKRRETGEKGETTRGSSKREA
jgi:transposase